MGVRRGYVDGAQVTPSSIQHFFASERVFDLLKAFGVVELANEVVVVCRGLVLVLEVRLAVAQLS